MCSALCGQWKGPFPFLMQAPAVGENAAAVSRALARGPPGCWQHFLDLFFFLSPPPVSIISAALGISIEIFLFCVFFFFFWSFCERPEAGRLYLLGSRTQGSECIFPKRLRKRDGLGYSIFYLYFYFLHFSSLGGQLRAAA